MVGVGAAEGTADGRADGIADGRAEGRRVGVRDGDDEGTRVGAAEGGREGTRVGAKEGDTLGRDDGWALGRVVGAPVGKPDGLVVGAPVEGGGVVGGAVGEGEGFCVGALVALGQYCVGQGVIVTLAKARARAGKALCTDPKSWQFRAVISGFWPDNESMALRNTGAAGRKPPPPPPGVAPWRTNRLRHADDENSAMSVRVLVHGLTYHVTVPRHGTFGWLMSEVIRRWMEEHDSDPQIAGLRTIVGDGCVLFDPADEVSDICESDEELLAVADASAELIGGERAAQPRPLEGLGILRLFRVCQC